jgi:hypothetical protein
MTAIRRTISRRAFTLFELMIGMLVTSLVVGAAAALMSAVAQGWTQSEASGYGSNRVTMTHVRLQRILRAAKQLGAVRSGAIEGTSPADILIWKEDTNLDNKVQFSELALLEHTPADGKLRYYEVNYPSSWTNAQKTAADTPSLADDDIYNDASIDSFKSAAYVESTVLAEHISGAEFSKYDSSSSIRPRFEYLLNFNASGVSETEYGSVSSRAAATRPSSQGG